MYGLAAVPVAAEGRVIGAGALEQCDWSEDEKLFYLQATRRAAEDNESAEIRVETRQEKEERERALGERLSRASQAEVLQLRLEQEQYARHGIPERWCSGSGDQATIVSVRVRKTAARTARNRALILGAERQLQQRWGSGGAYSGGVSGGEVPEICARSPLSLSCQRAREERKQSAERRQPPPVPSRRPPVVKLVTLASVSWINGQTAPFDNLLGPGNVFAWQPDWIPKTYIGLAATANHRPPDHVADWRAFRSARDFRALMVCRLRLAFDPVSGALIDSEVVERVVDPGYTPPFDTGRLRDDVAGALIWFFDSDVRDRNYYPGDLSATSDVVAGPHPASGLSFVAGERVLCSGVIKMRAGPHTDAIGIRSVRSPYHVPWVWSEFAFTYDGRQFRYRYRASIFPTTSWYLDGRRIAEQPEVFDLEFEAFAPGIPLVIDQSKLRLIPVLIRGVPASEPQAPTSSRPPGRVELHPHTAPGGQAGSRSILPSVLGAP